MTGDNLWTINDAAALLDPPMNVDEIRRMVQLFRIPARGRLRPGYAIGRPPNLFAARDLLDVHALVVKERSRLNRQPHLRNPS